MYFLESGLPCLVATGHACFGYHKMLAYASNFLIFITIMIGSSRYFYWMRLQLISTLLQEWTYLIFLRKNANRYALLNLFSTLVSIILDTSLCCQIIMPITLLSNLGIYCID